jgi:NADH dehydrogenase
MSRDSTQKPANPPPSPTHVVILGSGFAGIEVLKKLQKEYDDNSSIEITLISKDNFILFTPMLPEVASGMIETRNIVTPVRSFCKKAKFYEAKVESIDLDNKQLTFTHVIGRQSQPNDWREHIVKYDYLVIALGSENNFFKMSDVKRWSFTMKSINDAIILRNHIINLLEQASIEEDNKEPRKSLLTFVVAGGGFNGVETVGAINDFIRESIKDYYKNIHMSEVRVILIDSNEKLLAEVDEELGEFALEKLKVSGVEFMMKCPVTGATPNTIMLYNGTIIPCYTLIWSAGVTPSKLVAELPCEHDRGHRIVANNYLEVPGYNGVYVLGDCASITDPRTGKPYPPTAQHAIRQGKVAAKNIISALKGEDKNKIKFDYKTKGMMAEIGKRDGVAILFNKFKLHGFLAWWLWRTYYLANLPTARKKLKVLGDWSSDLIFKPDISMITREEKDSGEEQEKID